VKLEHAFEVPASPQATLKLLLDAERVVPCMPGAQLTEVVDEHHWKAKMTVKLGPVGMDFLNDVTLTEVDEAGGRVQMQATGRDTRGKGGASADIDANFVGVEGGTRVEMNTDLRFSGQAAQLGRPSVVQDVSTKLVGQFAECLKAQLAASTPEEAARAAEQARASQTHISGLSLMWAAIKGALARLTGRGPKTQKGGSA
jgi:carbon monoxide dehydrogenase subunit G